MSDSNFAVVMDFLGITPQALSVAIGADVTLISRWRTGGRKLVAGRKWVQLVAAFFIERDAAQKPPVLARVLAAFYPTDEVDEPEDQQRALERLLTHKNQFSEGYQIKRRQLLMDVFSPAPEQETKRRDNKEKGRHEVVLGQKNIRSAILAFLDKAVETGEALDIRFVCPEGLALITENEAFGTALMDRMMQLYAAGSRMKVVLRTDFKMSEVSYFSGRWLVAHLLGYVRSYYYDDFRKLNDLTMMGMFGDKLIGRIVPDEKHGLRGDFHYNLPEADAFEKEFAQYFISSTQRFHYDFFSQPDDFLTDVPARVSGGSYQLTKLPHFGLRSAVFDELKLSEDEMARLRAQFAPLLHTPDTLNGHGHIYQVFCADEIEAALDKPRHIVGELGTILGRRVYMPTQVLVNQLSAIRQLLASRERYHVCFLPEQAFEQFVMQIAVWGNEAAICWIPGGRSTACKDYTNVGALHGFCATIWARIPGVMKSQGVVNNKLNTWLKRAKKFGYVVE